jgi:PPP family 3-phenylpropionic acid transporter
VAPRLAAFYAAVYGTVGVLVPFLPVWLASRELSADEIGVVLGVGLWVRVATVPLVGRIADRTGRSKRMMVTLGIVAGAAWAAHALGSGVATFALLALLANGAYSGIAPLGETIAIRSGVDYGRVRLWGSLAFIAAALGTGALLDHAPTDVILWLVVAGALSVVLVCATFPTDRARAPVADATSGGIASLLGRRAFAIFLVTAGAAHASHAVYYAFASIHWRAAGISDGVVGLLWSEGVIAEVVLFAFGARVMASVRPSTLLAAAGVAAMVRFLVLATTTSLPALAAVQLLHALTFGATHLGAMAFLARRVPRELAATGQALYSVAGTGLSLGLATPIAGLLYERWQGGAYLLSVALGALALVLALLLRITPDEDTLARARI